MSISLMAELWRRDCGPDLLLLLSLADHADDDGGRIFPSLAYTAWRIGVGRSTVKRRVRALRESGVLEVITEASRYEPAHYRLHVEKLTAKGPFERAQNGPPGETGGPLGGQQGGQNEASRGAIAVTPEPPTEPLVETPSRLVTDEDDRRAEVFEGWYVNERDKRRGEKMKRVPKSWRSSARKIVVGKSGAEIRAIVLWALDRGEYIAGKAATLPDLAKNYGDLRLRWLADQNAQQRSQAIRQERERAEQGPGPSPYNNSCYLHDRMVKFNGLVCPACKAEEEAA